MKKFVFGFALVVILTITTIAQEPPTVSPALNDHLDDLSTITSQIRGLEPLTPVTRHFPTREEVAVFLRDSYNEELTDEIVLREEQFYRAFDFVEGGFNLREAYIDLLSAQVAGYYDPETQEMNTLLLSGESLGDTLPLVEQITYVHEFTHALQDQYFDLEALRAGAAQDEPDLGIAILALIEGDATLVMNDYTMIAVERDPGAALQLLLDPTVLASAEFPEGTPAILEAELQFPYIVGLYFVQTLREEGGWEAINAAFSNLPQSSEQVMHPEKYFAGEAPQTVAVNDATAALDSAGWQRLAERTLGEFYLRRYLINYLDQPTVNAAATGWGGDRYVLYYNKAMDARAWVLNLGWDAEAEAAEFAEAYGAYASLRTGSSPEAVPLNGAASGAASEVKCWRDAVRSDALCLFSDAARARTTVTNAPSLEEAVAMIVAQR